MNKKILLLVFTFVFLSIDIVEAAVPQLISLQGRLTNPTTGSAYTGALTITFSIWNASSFGTNMWIETQTVNLDSNGFFDVLLGGVSPIPQLSEDSYLQLEIGGEVLSPRQRIVSSAFALRAGTAEDVNCVGCVTDTEISGPIMGTKISPDFGSQNILTTGNLSVGGRYHDDDVQLYNVTSGEVICNFVSSSFTRFCNLNLIFTTDHESLLIMNMNAIAYPSATNIYLHAGFFVDGNPVLPFGDAIFSWGQFYVQPSVSGWLPVSFTQQYIVPAGTHSVEVQARSGGSNWRIEFAAMQVAVIPR